jgi:hypothetical protein
MSEKVIIGHLNPGDPFFEIFPDGTVPLIHPFPVVFVFAPEPCYLVDGSKLNDLSVTQISEAVMRLHPDFFSNLEEAKASVGKDFPMLCSRFSGIESDNPGLIFFCMDDRFDADDNRDLDEHTEPNHDEWESPS